MDVFQLIAGEGPIVAAAIHSGHSIRPEVLERLSIADEHRLREEDPFTDFLIAWAPTRFIGRRSRYEVDLNRPRDAAVYCLPEHCWGVDIWRDQPTDDVISRSLTSYDVFYATVHAVLSELVKVHGRIVVLDVHSYNHRRGGGDAPPADAATHPEVNIGTGTMDRAYWAPVVDPFLDALRRYDYLGRSLDVRENVKFQGGNFCRWIHSKFPGSVCAIAIEFRKFFMDEWTGEVDRRQLTAIQSALESTAPQLLKSLSDMRARNLSHS